MSNRIRYHETSHAQFIRVDECDFDIAILLILVTNILKFTKFSNYLESKKRLFSSLKSSGKIIEKAIINIDEFLLKEFIDCV